MTNRISLPPQDFQKMCKQAERDLEARKLLILMDRVKRQIAQRDHPEMESSKRPVSTISSGTGVGRLPSRQSPFER